MRYLPIHHSLYTETSITCPTTSCYRFTLQEGNEADVGFAFGAGFLPQCNSSTLTRRVELLAVAGETQAHDGLLEEVDDNVTYRTQVPRAPHAARNRQGWEGLTDPWCVYISEKTWLGQLVLSIRMYVLVACSIVQCTVCEYVKHRDERCQRSWYDSVGIW